MIHSSCDEENQLRPDERLVPSMFVYLTLTAGLSVIS